MQISIGLPFLNAAATLPAAIRSVFAQTYSDWELLLVDDGSTDGSLAIARSIVDSRVRVCSDGANRGLVYRLNQIAQLASGEYLARMDADDLMHPRRLAAQVEFLDAHPQVDVVDTAIYSMDGDGRLTGVRGRQTFEASPHTALRGSLLHHPTVLGRAAWFRANPYDPHYLRAEDHELWCRTIKHTNFARLADPLYFYREGEIHVKNYLQSCRTDRKIIRRYGTEVAGQWETLRLLVASNVKSVLCSLLVRLHVDGVMIALRNRGLASAELEAASAVLRQMADTYVPGMNTLLHQATERRAA